MLTRLGGDEFAGGDDPMGLGHCNRRDAIRGTLAAVAATSWVEGLALADDAPPGLLVRKAEPLNAEPPLDRLDSWITPIDRFFIRSHQPQPEHVPDAPVKVGGLVDQPRSYGPADLRKMESVTIPAVLQCTGNGRTRFNPIPGGVGWGQGAVGNAEWTGVRLRDLLERAGLAKGAKHVHLRGRDEPAGPKDAIYLRSLPIERAMNPSTIVAFTMNGKDLPAMHGGPVRLVVPGWTGNHWIKWLREITVAEDEAPGTFQRVDYRLPKTPQPRDAVVKPEDTVPVTALNVKSILTAPHPRPSAEAAKAPLQGFAWTGNGRVAKVEVSIDDGPWKSAELVGPDHEGAWRMWRFAWDVTMGEHHVRVRATDTTGAVQPDVTPWNKGGYLWNGIESVKFLVDTPGK